jgi:hypothetical protein
MIHLLGKPFKIHGVHFSVFENKDLEMKLSKCNHTRDNKDSTEYNIDMQGKLRLNVIKTMTVPALE